ncbi:Anaphase-promoting complex subunit 7 [Geodia barretti]|uniref:Anaphase-promoting complex subunit 7 n=3 Tax=Geodia barretti TaxID=519541 RepID=A0AA35RH82_GEOBA|nr:Anaphase-promoting complex subunit 7 [Geodia barretti]
MFSATWTRTPDSSQTSRNWKSCLVLWWHASDSHSECWVAKAWYQTRNAALSSLERSRASVLLENAYSYSLRNAEAAFCHASLFWTKQDVHSAVQKYQEAVHIDPSFSEAYEALVRCYLVMRRDREALSLARAASQHIRRPVFHYYLQGIALSQKPATTDKCRVLLEKAVKTDPSYQQAVIQLSKLYLREGAGENAVDLLRKHSDIHSCPLVHTELGNCLTLLKRHQEAMEHYSQALIQDPTFEKALQGMELLQQQLQSGGGGGGGGGGDHENSEDRGQLLAVRPLDLENPLEMDSDEDVLELPYQDHNMW